MVSVHFSVSPLYKSVIGLSLIVVSDVRERRVPGVMRDGRTQTARHNNYTLFTLWRGTIKQSSRL